MTAPSAKQLSYDSVADFAGTEMQVEPTLMQLAFSQGESEKLKSQLV
jgi:hypothetical protein